MFLAAADIGGTTITVSIAAIDGIQIKLHQSTKRSGDNRTIPRQVMELVSRAYSMLGIDRKYVSALGVCAASPFEMRSGQCELVTLTLCGGIGEGSPSLPNDWTSIPLETELRTTFPNLRIENDCVGSVIAERLFGAGRGEDNLVYVTWSTGIGAGAFTDGRVLRGKNGNAMHLGYLLLCGERGPPAFGDQTSLERLESFIGGPELEQRYGAPVPQIFSDYRSGNPRAQELVNWAADLFTTGLINMTCLLDSRVIVVGGSIAFHNWDILCPLVEERLRRRYPALTREVELRRSAIGGNLGDLAALSLVMPDEWIATYSKNEPWHHAPPPVFLDP